MNNLYTISPNTQSKYYFRWLQNLTDNLCKCFNHQDRSNTDCQNIFNILHFVNCNDFHIMCKHLEWVYIPNNWENHNININHLNQQCICYRIIRKPNNCFGIVYNYYHCKNNIFSFLVQNHLRKDDIYFDGQGIKDKNHYSSDTFHLTFFDTLGHIVYIAMDPKDIKYSHLNKVYIFLQKPLFYLNIVCIPYNFEDTSHSFPWNKEDTSYR